MQNRRELTYVQNADAICAACKTEIEESEPPICDRPGARALRARPSMDASPLSQSLEALMAAAAEEEKAFCR